MMTTTPSSSKIQRKIRSFFVTTLLTGLTLFLGAGSVLFVDESEHVLVERFGVIVAVYDRTGPEGDRGWKWKLPWPIETVRRFDRRLQIFDPPAREMFTRDKKNITVDSYLCWKIRDPEPGELQRFDDRPVVRFYRTLGSSALAEVRLETRLRSVMAAAIGQVELSQLLVATDSNAGPSGESPLSQLTDSVTTKIQQDQEGDSLESQYGIELVDVGIKRFNLPEANLFAVYERMRKEREKIAQRYRSAGEAEKQLIESQATRLQTEILSSARAEAERIQGAGEAEALAIRNAVYSRDPEFFQVMRTLEGYEKILNKQTTLVLSASSRLFRLLSDGPGEEVPVKGNQDELPAVPKEAP